MLRRDVDLEMSRISLRGESDPLVPEYASTSEIQEVDSESDDLPICRICFEHEAPLDNKLISPCLCKGTQQFVHRRCLDHWRSTKEGFAFSHCTTCNARFHFHVMEMTNHMWRKIKFNMFLARDIFYVFLAIQSVIAVLGVLVYAIDTEGTFPDFFNRTWDRLFSNHPYAFYYSAGAALFLVPFGIIGLAMHCARHIRDIRVARCRNCSVRWSILNCFPTTTEGFVPTVIGFVVVLFVLGFAYGFLAASVLLQKWLQESYHVYAKKGLTKEYVVVDLHGHYTIPRLDPRHEERLRCLELL